ncbi:MAG: ABC transporter permease subunit [Acidimicrobiia bacterium]|nr:ABC transporter permease subunit [Acidimicrobiia bacterium]
MTSKTRVLLAVIPLLFIGYLFVYPVARIILLGLGDAEPGQLFQGGRIGSVVWFTFWQALVSTALTVIVAAPLTWVISRFEFPGRRLAQAAVVVPFVLPTVVVGAAFAALGVRGSVWAILVAHTFYNIAVVVRTVGGMWASVDTRIEDAARTLGAGRWQTFWYVILPTLRPAIMASAAIVFLFCFTSFGVVLILGGRGNATLEVEIYQQAVTFFNLPLAALLAVLQLVGVSAALAWYSRSQERASRGLDLAGEQSIRRRPTGRFRWIVGFIVVGTLGLQFVPLATLVVRGLGWFGDLAIEDPVVGVPLESIPRSLGFAGIATVVAVLVGMLAASVVSGRRSAFSRWFDTALMLPLGTSAVTVGFGFLVALNWPVDLRGTVWLVPLAHALVAVPFVVRSAVPLLRSIRPQLLESAAMLGAPPGRAWRSVALPIASRAAALGAGFAFVVSLGEFGATSFIARPSSVTVPVTIFRLLGRPGDANFGRAMALAVVLAVLTAAVVTIIDRLGEVGRF